MLSEAGMNQHVLVVDDEAQIRDLLSLYIQRHGYCTLAAATSDEMMRWLQDSKVDLVVLDIGLQNEDGLRLLPTLKSQYPCLKVIMLTGMGLCEDLLEEAVRQGADGYVSKTSPLDELLLAINRVLRPEQSPAFS